MRALGVRPAAGVTLAVVALVAALLAALGPAADERSRYVWPPADLEGETPARAWAAPLPLVQREAERLTVRLPCSLVPPLRAEGAAGSTTVLATARDPVAAGGLALTATPRALLVAVGADAVARIPWPPPAGAGAACEGVLAIGESAWSFRREDGAVLAGGELPRAPVVTGLFSEADLRRFGLAVEVTTRVSGTSPSLRQQVSAALAAACALAALALVLPSAGRRRPGAVRALLRRALLALRPVDGVVAAVLGAWWIVGPAFYDDGWVRARQLNYAVSGTFSNYYDTWGVTLPLGYWLEWLQHWLMLGSSAVPVLRLPALALGAAAWVVCRRCLARVARPVVHGRAASQWGLAAAFLVGFVSWGMTLRPEPAVSFLAVLSLAAMLRFLQAPSLGPLALAGVVGALALSAHPAGLVALAPVLASSGQIVAWARGRKAALWTGIGTVGLAGVSLFVVLLFLDSDLGQLRANSSLVRTAHPTGFGEELTRYTALSGEEWGTAARRVSVVLLLVAVLGYLTRRALRSSAALDLPARTLAFALALLVFTPSKWPWHFGALTALGAVALAAEVAHLTDGGLRDRARWSLRPLAAVLVVLAATKWAWGLRTQWVTLDLRTLHWPADAGDVLGVARPFSLVSLPQALVVAAAFLAAVAAVELWRGGRARLPRAPWVVAAWIVPLVALPLLVVTVGTFARDGLASDVWTLSGQSGDSLRGRGTCGLGDEVVVPSPGSMTALPAVTDANGGAPPGEAAFGPSGLWPPSSAPPVPGLLHWGSRVPDEDARGRFESPWFALPANAATGVGLFVAGRIGPGDSVALEWGRRRGAAVESLSVAGVEAGEAVGTELIASPWQFLAAASLPRPPGDADAVRIRAADESRGPDAWLAVSAPVGYERETLSSALRRDGVRALVSPTLLLYFPCAAIPRLEDGVAELPDWVIIEERDVLWPLDQADSPFNAVLDLGALAKLPLADSEAPPERVRVYHVDRGNSGEVVLPAARAWPYS